MHSTIPRVSVLVPTYNRGQLLQETLESILGQTFTDFEVVIVDNASTDNTTQLVAAITDDRLVYVRNEVNIGAVHNYNKALRLARGEYIYLFSDDDLMTDVNNLKIKVGILDTNPSVGVVHGDYDVFDATGRIGGNYISTTPIWQKIHPVPLLKGNVAYHFLYAGQNFISMTASLLRGSVLRENRLEFNNQLRYAVDWNLWLQMSLFCDFYYINKVLTAHRRHPQNESLLVTQTIYYKEHILAKIGLLTLFGHLDKIPYATVDDVLRTTKNPDSLTQNIIRNFGRAQRRILKVISGK